MSVVAYYWYQLTHRYVYSANYRCVGWTRYVALVKEECHQITAWSPTAGTPTGPTLLLHPSPPRNPLHVITFHSRLIRGP